MYREPGGVAFTLHRTADTDVAARDLRTRASGCIDRAKIGTPGRGSLCCACARLHRSGYVRRWLSWSSTHFIYADPGQFCWHGGLVAPVAVREPELDAKSLSAGPGLILFEFGSRSLDIYTYSTSQGPGRCLEGPFSAPGSTVPGFFSSFSFKVCLKHILKTTSVCFHMPKRHSG